jgi:hypothetical protein
MHIEIQKILETAAVTQEITPTSIHNEAEYGMLKQVGVTGAGGFIASWVVKLYEGVFHRCVPYSFALLLATSLTPRLASKTPKFSFRVKSQNQDL